MGTRGLFRVSVSLHWTLDGHRVKVNFLRKQPRKHRCREWPLPLGAPCVGRRPPSHGEWGVPPWQVAAWERGLVAFKRSKKSEPGHVSPDVLKYVLAEAKQNCVGRTEDSQARRCVSQGWGVSQTPVQGKWRPTTGAGGRCLDVGPAWNRGEGCGHPARQERED